MSVVRRFEVQCDRCRCRREWSMELFANSAGITKGGGTEELRKEARAAGWSHRRIRGQGSRAIGIDLCPKCAHYGSPRMVWFQFISEDGT